MKKESVSLTGTDCGTPANHRRSVSLALGQLRFGVLAACWGVSLALIGQIVIFAMVQFTDLRWEEIKVTQEHPLVVSGTAGARSRTSLDRAPQRVGVEPRESVNPNFVKSRWDRLFGTIMALSRGFGTMAMLALTPLIILGVLLAASAAMDGVERTVSAFGWAMVVAILILPIGSAIGLPWEAGALAGYEPMAEQIDALAGGSPAIGDQVVLYAQFLVLPLMCIAGLTVCAIKFQHGIEDGLLVREDLRIDETLEQEAGGVEAGSLHGSRTAAALQKTMVQPPSAPPDSIPVSRPEPKPDGKPTLKPVGPMSTQEDPPPPRRLI